MPNSKQIVYLSQAQYAELIANGTITVNGVTVTYDENDIYVTPQAEPVTDVRVNGTSVAANGIANIPIASKSSFGVVKQAGTGYSISIQNDGTLKVIGADIATIKGGSSNSSRPILPNATHAATFYGLTRAAGVNMASSSNEVGTYTPEAKGAIQSMLGVSDLIATAENSLVASKAYAVGDVFTANGKLYKVTTAIAENDAIVLQNDGETISGANAVETKVGEGFVKFTDIATNNDFGIVKVSSSNYGLKYLDNNPGIIAIRAASDDNIKNSYSDFAPIVSGKQDKSVFYGLAKAAGADEKDSILPVGQYTDAAKVAIRSMIGATSSNVIAVQDTQPTDTDTKIWLPGSAEPPVTVPTVAEMNAALAGKVDDVQVNGVSVLNNGVANVPIATDTTPGAVKIAGAVQYVSNRPGNIYIAEPTDNGVKGGSTTTFAVTISKQHMATFYGLAKAAGDTTQSASSNAVGNYTTEAKLAIQQMLGIETTTVNISGATATITAEPNHRYICGEVTSVDFTPCARGICELIFTSGTTLPVLTLPSTVKMPEWFEVETEKIYDIIITDGVYGVVTSWAM